LHFKLSEYRRSLSAILAWMLLTGLIGSYRVLVWDHAESNTSFQNVSVDDAYDMITNGSFPDLVVLDVRNQSEYDLGHLYKAVLIPLYELETRISELEDHKNDEIIVYCWSGYRSQKASEILTNKGFTKVYNMLGGIKAWMEAGYPIYTTYHHVTIDVMEEETVLEIEPLLQTMCISCAQNRACPSYSQPENVQFRVLEENETYTLSLLSYEVNGTIFEVTIANTLLWSYIESTDEANRTARFTKTEVTTENMHVQFYSLSYIVQHKEYNLTIFTSLKPLNSETYNSSFTFINYAPSRKSEVTTLEFVDFNMSVTLSQQYTILSRLAKEIGKVYEKSGDETLQALARNYKNMKEETKYLSKLVEKQLQEYDLLIFKPMAVILDITWQCAFCLVHCGLMTVECGVICGEALIGCTVAPPLCPIFAATCIVCLAGNTYCWFVYCEYECAGG